MKYNRASLMDTVRVAKKLSKQSYVFATANGCIIANNPPPASQRYVSVDKEGNIFYHNPIFIEDITEEIKLRR